MTKQKPSIIFTVTNDLTYDQRMIRICRTLAQNGYEVALWGRSRTQSRPLSEEPFQQYRLNCWFQKGKFFYLEYNLRLWLKLLFARYDLIGAIDLDTLAAAWFAARLRNKPCVYDAHEYFTEVPEVVGRPMIQKVWRMVERFFVPRVNGAYTVCESLAELFHRQYQVAFTVIRNVPFRQKERAKPDPRRIILYQGALNDGRGLPEVIEAMKYIDKAILWLAGEGDLSTQLRAQVVEMQLSGKVVFLGFLPPDELKKVTLQATIGLNLLENKGLSYYFSLANKAFDYIQAGIPALHMDFPEYSKLNQRFETSLLVADLEIKTLVSALQKLLKDDVFYQRLHQNCQPASEEWIWEKEQKKLLEFYENILP